MPTPATAKVPKPRSDDEFEDIATDAMRLRLRSPTVMRYGRSGQAQFGIDATANAPHAPGLVGFQYKNVAKLTLKEVETETAKAATFTPAISEYWIVTSLNRDAKLHAQVLSLSDERGKRGQFAVRLLFWEDVCNDLATDDKIFSKYYQWPSERGAIPPWPDVKLRTLDGLHMSGMNHPGRNSPLFRDHRLSIQATSSLLLQQLSLRVQVDEGLWDHVTIEKPAGCEVSLRPEGDEWVARGDRAGSFVTARRAAPESFCISIQVLPPACQIRIILRTVLNVAPMALVLFPPEADRSWRHTLKARSCMATVRTWNAESFSFR
jgi:hypothetical protein